MSNRLRELRNEKRLTLRELGELTKISYSTISSMENDIRPFTQNNLEILSNFFNVSTDYLLGKTDDRIPASTPSAKEQLKGVQLALFNQVGELTEDQAEDVLQFINFIKTKGENKWNI